MLNKSRFPGFANLARAIFVAATILIMSGAFRTQPVSAQGTTPTPDSATFLAQQGARISYSAQTGTAHFIGAPLNQPISVTAALPPTPSQSDVARGFLVQYGALFGLRDQAQELSVVRQKAPDNTRSFVRFQQVYQGIPVLGGEMIVQVTAANQILSANGEISSGIKVAVASSITASTAQQSALNLVAKTYQIDVARLTATKPQLWIYDPKLIGPTSGPVRLVWRMDVTSTDFPPVRELVLVDAQTGGIQLHFNQIDTFGVAGDRATTVQTGNKENGRLSSSNNFAPPDQTLLGTPLISIYTKNNTSGEGTPGTLVCTQANPSACNTDVDAQLAYQYSLDTYNFYANSFSRDSINGSGMPIISSVHYGPVGYQNAFWNGAQMFYGDGFSTGDDVVGHELTHGVTQYESNLLYFYQSGAINESLSDVFGEFMDLTNGLGNDSPGVRWLLGEDIPIGAIRSMSNPPAFNDPDKMTSPNYYTLAFCPDNPPGYCDTGGVHFNSGVNNKAAFLITDGGSFNGQVITGLGVTKAARIYYEVQTNLLTSGSDYADLYNVLYQGCLTLIGTVGITSGDCQQVRNATIAVEMNLQPVAGYNPEAEICPAGQAPSNLFYNTFESGIAGWSLAAIAGSNHWTINDSIYGPNAHSGVKSLYADDFFASSNSAAAMASGVTLPANAFLHFHHAYDLERTFDGGLIEYSANGGPWINGGSLINSGKAYDTLSVASLGTFGFSGASHGYVSTRLNLSSLAGQNVRFRWRLATDINTYYLGWWVDDVRIYTCPTAPTITGFTPTSGPVGTTVTISGTNFTGATAVRFNGTNASTFNVVSATSISATVPPAATSGTISVTTPQGTATSASNFTVTLPVSLDIGSYEETNPNLTYSGNWLSYSGAGPKGGSFKYTNDPNARVTFSIHNTVGRMIIYRTVASGYGAMSVYVDGISTGTIPGASSGVNWAQPYMFTLTPGNHVVQLRNTSGSYIGFEAFDLLAPAVPLIDGHFEDNNPALTYWGNWPEVVGSGPLGGSMRYTNDPQGKLTFTIEGQADTLAIHYTADPSYGTLEISLTTYQGTSVPTVNTQASARSWDRIAVIPLNASSQGTVVELRPAAGSTIAIDAIDVLRAGIVATPNLYQENAPELTYIGNWTNYNGSGPLGGNMRYTNQPGASIVFTMAGLNSVTVYRTMHPNYGSLEICIFGQGYVNCPTFDQTSSGLVWGQPVTVYADAPGVYYVRIRNPGSRYLGVEAVEVRGYSPHNYPRLSATTRLEDNDPRLVYNGGSWLDFNGNGPIGGNVRSSNSPNARLRFLIDSTVGQIVLYRPLNPTYGSVNVYVDGSLRGTINNNAASQIWSRPYILHVTPNDSTIEFVSASGGTIAFEAIDLLPPVQPLGIGNYEETNPNLTYTGNWISYSGAGPNGGSLRYTNDPTAEVTFSTTGRFLTLYRTRASNRGPIEVCIDAICQTVINNSATLQWNAPVTFYLGLVAARNVHIRNLSASYIDLDAIWVADSLDPLIAGLHDNTHENIGYSIGWTTFSGTGPSGNTLHFTNIQDATLSFNFTGNGLILYRTTAPNRGPMQVCIDGNCQTTITNNSATLQWNVPVTDFASLANGDHQVIIRNLTSSYIDLDAVRVLAPPVPLGAGLHQQDNPNITYVGTWTTYGNAAVNGGSLIYSNSPAAEIRFQIDGDSLTLYRTRYTNRGPMQVCIDSILPCTTVANTTAALQWNVPITLEIPTAGVHDIVIINLSSNYIDLDAVRVGSIPTAFDPPGPYDERDTRFTYNGLWYSYNGAGPFNNTLLYSNTPGDSIRFRFTGEAFRLYRTTAPNRGPMEVCIDASCQTISNNSSAVVWSAPVLVSNPTGGTHIVTITHTGTTAQYIDLDSIVVYATTPPSLIVASVTPTATSTVVEATATLLPTEAVPTTTLPTSETPVETATPTVEASPEPSATPVPTEVPTETPIPSPVPTEIPPTPEPTATPPPTETPTETPAGG